MHVSRRWRTLVLGSPRRLKLQLFCGPETPVRDLDIWPALPLVIKNINSRTNAWVEKMDNIVAVLLEHSNRVCQMEFLCVSSSPKEKVLAAMHVPFPELTYLWLESDVTAVVSDSFLGGSAPLLESFYLSRIPFPGLPKLFLSPTHLVNLQLLDIPHSGYIPPETLLTTLSVCTGLRYFTLEFQSPRSCPDQTSRLPPPPTRTVLPFLTLLSFTGACEYLEDLIGGIDAPRLDNLFIRFFNDIIFDTPQLSQLISRTPTFESLKKVYVSFNDHVSGVMLSSLTSYIPSFTVDILCTPPDWQISSLEQLCSSLPSFSTLEDLYIFQNELNEPGWKDNIENALWLGLLQPFTTVKNLYVSEKFAPRIEPALQELAGARTTEVLPALQNIFLEGLQPSGVAHEGIQQFVSMRQLISHPIAVSHWDPDWTRLH